MLDENARESFVEHQEFLAMKAQKSARLKETLCQTLTGTMRSTSAR